MVEANRDRRAQTRPVAEPCNLLVSHALRPGGAARAEVRRVLEALGDRAPRVRRTAARGLLGAWTSLDPRGVVRALPGLWRQDPSPIRDTVKWIPVDVWTRSDDDSLRQAVLSVRDDIRPGERWRMTVEKHRYVSRHRDEVIAMLADLVTAPVDLVHPDKILRLDLIADEAAVAVLLPGELFSAATAVAGREGG